MTQSKYQNRYYYFFNHLIDLILLNFYFLFTSIVTLGIGIGAGFTAMIYTVYHGYRKDEGNYRKLYFKSFKENFLKMTIYYLIGFIIISLVMITPNFINSISPTVYDGIRAFIVIEVIMNLIYVCAQQAKIHLSLWRSFLGALFMAHANFMTSFLFVLILGVSYFLLVPTRGYLVFLIFTLLAFLAERLVLEKIIIEQYTTDEMKDILTITPIKMDEDMSK